MIKFGRSALAFNMAVTGLIGMAIMALPAGALRAANVQLPLKFQFGPGRHVPGYIQRASEYGLYWPDENLDILGGKW